MSFKSKGTVKKKNAVIYARYSSDNQHETSIEAQVQAAEAYARNNGYTVTARYIDRAKSGTSTKSRPEFKRMIEDSKKGEFQAVIVHKLDRFSRNTVDSEVNRMILMNNGVELLSVIEQFTGKPEDTILRAIITALAQYYSENLSREVMKGMMVQAKKCLHIAGIPPLGYDVDPKTRLLVINPVEAETVRKIYELYLSGYGYDKMAKTLNSLGYRTKGGKEFVHNSFHDLLRNKKYAGYYIYNRSSHKDCLGRRNNHKDKDPNEIIEIKGGIPAIIDEETYNKAMAKMEKNKHMPGAYSARHTYLLSGLVKCGVCGKSMIGETRTGGKAKNVTVSYRCNHNHSKCNNTEVKAAALEEYVLTLLERYIFDEKNIPVILEGIKEFFTEQDYHNADEIKRLNDVIRGLNRKLTNIKNIMMDGRAEEFFLEDLMKIKADIARLEEERDNIPQTKINPEITEEMLRGLIGSFAVRVRDRNNEDCKQFINDFVDSIVVYRDKVEANLKIALPDTEGFTLTRTVNRQFLPTVNKK